MDGEEARRGATREEGEKDWAETRERREARGRRRDIGLRERRVSGCNMERKGGGKRTFGVERKSRRGRERDGVVLVRFDSAEQQHE